MVVNQGLMMLQNAEQVYKHSLLPRKRNLKKSPEHELDNLYQKINVYLDLVLPVQFVIV